jgi:Tol biopolymer transport system component
MWLNIIRNKVIGVMLPSLINSAFKRRVYIGGFWILMLGVLISCQGGQSNPPTQIIPLHTTLIPSGEIQTPEASPTKTFIPSLANSNSGSKLQTFQTATLTSTPSYVDPRDALSPGTYLVYWSQNAWYIKSIDSSQPIRFLTIESQSDFASLSPDGRSVAFVSNENEIMVFDLDTGALLAYPTPEDLFVIRSLEWSPDGQMLIYDGKPCVFHDCSSGIYALLLESGKTQILIDWSSEIDPFDLGGSQSTWSPNGQWIAFRSFRNLGDRFPSDLYVMDANCITNLTSCSEESWLLGEGYDPVWSPESMLTFSNSTGEQLGPWLMDVSNDGSSRLLVNMKGLSEGIGDLKWSPDGKILGFTNDIWISSDQNPAGDVFVFYKDNQKVVNLTNTPIERERINGWSPNGEYITYTQYGKMLTEMNKWLEYHDQSDIFVVPIAGGEAINLTNTPYLAEVFSFWLEVKDTR